jgi:Gram-negative bacterial TonB protein C-terminal
MINENGRVANAEIANKKELHPRVAEEALRVVNSSQVWKPAVVLGEKVIFWYKQSIIFQVVKK